MRTHDIDYTVTLEQLLDLEAIAALLTNVTKFTIDKFEYPEIIQRILMLLPNLQYLPHQMRHSYRLTWMCEFDSTISITRNQDIY